MSKKLREAETHLAKKDKVMRNLIRVHGPCRLKLKGMDPFNVLVRSIISQQLSTKAADTILKRVELASGKSGTFHYETFLNVGHSKLRECGLSNAKASYTLGIAHLVQSEQLNFTQLQNLNNDAVIERMVEIKGVGQWTAEMFLIFALGRLDVLSTADVGLLRGAVISYNLKSRPTVDEFKNMAMVWKPFRSVASWYLWRNA